MSSARINTMFGMAALAAPMAARSNTSCDGVIFLDQTLLIVYGGMACTQHRALCTHGRVGKHARGIMGGGGGGGGDRGGAGDCARLLLAPPTRGFAGIAVSRQRENEG